MPKYNNILTAIDGSEASLKALEKAIVMAKLHHATLHIAHVVDIRAYSLAVAYRQPLAEYAEDNAKEILKEAKEKATAAGVKAVETLIRQGAPRSVIAKKIAPEVNADLIVMGATGYGMVERMFMGSVSESTMRHATCDVLVVRD